MPAEDILHELKEAYIAGFPSHLQEMEGHILAMEKGADTGTSAAQYQEHFEALFRRAHSLKGSGGTYGFTIITSICHQMEDYITDSLRNADDTQPSTFDNLFKYVDILKDTHALLINKSTDFQEIEEQLKHLKDEAISHESNGLLVGHVNNMYGQICKQVFAEANSHCTVVESSMDALRRSFHEHFDFIVTSKENIDLNGLALIAALKLNQRKGSTLKVILTTSNISNSSCEEIKPDFIVLKNKSFDVSLLKAIKEITKQN